MEKGLQLKAEILKELLEPYKSISIIGLEKNTGKTTTLNYILKLLQGKSIGLTSIGVDGEDIDSVTNTKKPKIYIKPNTLVATSKQSLLLSDVTFEILKVLDLSTPLGAIVIAKSTSYGFVELSGASTTMGLRLSIEQLHKFGASISIVDGALSRKSLASPTITAASILCIGAAFSLDAKVLVNETIKQITFFSLHKASPDIYNLYISTMKTCKLAFIYNKKIVKSTVNTLLGNSKEFISHINEELKYIFVKGTITDAVVKELITTYKAFNKLLIVIEDGTKLFLSYELYLIAINYGLVFEVLNQINLIGISVNPWSPSQHYLDYSFIKSKLRSNTNLPIFNVKLDMEE